VQQSELSNATTAPEEEKTEKQIFEEKKKALQGKRVVQVQKVDAEGNVLAEPNEDAKDAEQDAEDAKEMA